MPKFKSNEIVYHVLMHHINHYKEAKKVFKVDYDSDEECETTASTNQGFYGAKPDVSITFE